MDTLLIFMALKLSFLSADFENQPLADTTQTVFCFAKYEDDTEIFKAFPDTATMLDIRHYFQGNNDVYSGNALLQTPYFTVVNPYPDTETALKYIRLYGPIVEIGCQMNTPDLTSFKISSDNLNSR